MNTFKFKLETEINPDCEIKGLLDHKLSVHYQAVRRGQTSQSTVWHRRLGTCTYTCSNYLYVTTFPRLSNPLIA
jgi:hypothetical protein